MSRGYPSGFAPGKLGIVAQQPARFLNREQGFEFFDLAAQWDAGKDLGEQFTARTIHYGVSGGDDKGLRSLDVGFEGQAGLYRIMHALAA